LKDSVARAFSVSTSKGWPKHCCLHKALGPAKNAIPVDSKACEDILDELNMVAEAGGSS